MNSNTALSLALGVSIPLLIVLLVAVAVWVYRRWRFSLLRGYDKVSHELDDEELEFQRMIESRHGLPDEEFTFGGEDADEDLAELDAEEIETGLGFSAKERDRLTMIDKLRSNLVAATSSGEKEKLSDDEENDAEMKENMRL